MIQHIWSVFWPPESSWAAQRGAHRRYRARLSAAIPLQRSRSRRDNLYRPGGLRRTDFEYACHPIEYLSASAQSNPAFRDWSLSACRPMRMTPQWYCRGPRSYSCSARPPPGSRRPLPGASRRLSCATSQGGSASLGGKLLYYPGTRAVRRDLSTLIRQTWPGTTRKGNS